MTTAALKELHQIFQDHQLTITPEIELELLGLYNKLNKAARSHYSSETYKSMPTKQVEEFLVLTRDYKEKLNSLPDKTPEDMFKIDDLRQWEYKLTELLLQK